jgi:hypothetical protein
LALGASFACDSTSDGTDAAQADPCRGTGGDPDADEVCQAFDNCPVIKNAEQADADGDGVGDACDTNSDAPNACSGKGGDEDGDDVCQSNDNCPDRPNSAQRDSDGDGEGDDCDETPAACDDLGGDTDGDTLCNMLDNCPEVSNVNQLDRDNDNIGDVCDPDPPSDPSGTCEGLGGDDDDDDYCGYNDNCPTIANADQSDVDGDDIGDSCDKESCDGIDNDGDGELDEGFSDSDGDGTADCVDQCAQAPETDADSDGVLDCKDRCPNDPVNDPDLRQLSIDATGIAEDWVKADLFSGFSADFIIAGSRVYATSGAVLDPTVPKLLGSFPASGVIEADPALNEAYVAVSSSAINVYDTNTYTLKRVLAVSGVSSISQMLRAGAGGLAIRHSGGLKLVPLQ